MALATRLRAAAAAAVPALRTVVSTLVRDAALIGGGGLIAYGAWLIFAPAGYIVAGVLLAGGAMLAARVGQ